ncbi:T. brucei spp.-specific protein [Trypanosoma brucei gambiense DAL972]|uniref:T. brucei spp.-specific protein n=1 Tax=Trypanosoma brucei gambiense (strain MHOM/CI/86/DAL972) TaxID=679716 RepID=C9ZZI7_TRYB9|nr:T. brucei spp.-specific protein [Trypanosoma brucei gambiense DAL972]CBH14836.1 T. brucei spp.-specific protein [Trypanosoma brucei gambiense DAL972]|eukprot:XP_011777102.1 T. brucei spp.-specific protein [Trypanosoma brucei gambiense DAL972]
MWFIAPTPFALKHRCPAIVLGGFSLTAAVCCEVVALKQRRYIVKILKKGNSGAFSCSCILIGTLRWWPMALLVRGRYHEVTKKILKRQKGEKGKIFCHCATADAMILHESPHHYCKWAARGGSEDWDYSNSFVVVCAVLLENIATNEREGKCHLTFHAATSMHHDYMLVALRGKVVKAKVSFRFREV